MRHLSVEVLHNCIKESDLLGKDAILTHLPALYERFVLNVSPPAKQCY